MRLSICVQRALKAGLMAGAASVSMIAQAQTAAVEAASDPQGPAAQAAAEQATDVVVITSTPIRDSIEASLAVQREADNIVNAIASDTLGRFPDQTAAQALARLPGIATQRDQGQERFIQARGAPARWTVVSFDGVNVLGADERVFRFDSVPAALISSLELNKTLTPDQPAEALAGRVDIKSFSAIDNPGLKFFGEAGAGFVDLADGPVKSLAGRLSWGNDQFGAILTLSEFAFEQQTDNAEPRYDATGVTEQRNAKYIIDRQTSSQALKLEWRPNDTNRFSLSRLQTEFADDERRNQQTFQLLQGRNAVRSFAAADVAAVRVAGLFQLGNYKNATQHTVLHGEHEIADWDVSWDVGTTSTEFLTNLPLVQTQNSASLATRPSITASQTDDEGVYRFNLWNTVQTGANFTRGATSVAELNQTAIDTTVAIIFRQQIDTEAFFTKLDLDRDWTSFGADATFSAGVQYDNRVAADEGTWGFVAPNGTAPNNFTITAPGAVPVNRAAQFNFAWTPNDWFQTGQYWDQRLDRGHLASYARNDLIRSQFDGLVAALERAGVARVGPNKALANKVSETILAGYAQNRWRWDRHTLVAGVRVEQTDTGARGVAALTATSFTPVAIDTETTLVFPSLHYTYDLGEDIKLRAAYISGAARPDFVDMRATVTIADASQVIIGGNPLLEPETATGFDASAEWYFADAGLLAASAFYRDVSDVLFSSTQRVGDSRYNSGGIDRSNYNLTGVQNGGDGDLSGIEFSYYHPWTFLPGPLDGLGLQSSLTLVDGSFNNGVRDIRFPGSSETIANAAVFYEKYNASLRLGWTWRSDWVDEISPGSTGAGDLIWDETQRVDFSARYQVTDNFTLFMDVNNLTDEYGVRKIANQEAGGITFRPYEVESFGRRFLFGARVNF